MLYESLSSALISFFTTHHLNEIHAIRVSEGPKSGWKTRIKFMRPASPVSPQTPPIFGEEISPPPYLYDLLQKILPENSGAGHRALIASPGAWILIDRIPQLCALIPNKTLPRVETSTPLNMALSQAILPNGHWNNSLEQSAHQRLQAAIAFSQLSQSLPSQDLLPTGGVLHLIVSENVRALFHVSGIRRIHILALTQSSCLP